MTQRAVMSVVFAACALGVACGEDRASENVPPTAEFLVAAGDSTYWVRGGPDGVRVRSAPILLTSVDGQFYEVFVAAEAVEYDDASFATARVWSRPVLGADSLVLFQDSTVMQQAARWKRQHPREQPLDPDTDDLSENPRTLVSEDIEIVDVHGPWLTFIHVLDVDTESGDDHQHRGHQRVVDVRTGRLATLDDLIGITEARRITGVARRSFAGIIDSIRVAEDERAELARESLDSFRFDSTSFAITDVDRAPAIAFMVPGNGVDGEPIAMHLPPIAVNAPSWWDLVRATLPSWMRDSTDLQWERAGYRVSARPSPDGETLALVLQRNGTGRRGGQGAIAGGSETGTVSGTEGRASRSPEWPVATVPAPAYQLMSLDAPAVSAATRSALARAFDRSTALDGLVQQATYVPATGKRSFGGMRRE
ncbi:MAG: hypothetical protein V4617_21410 [Gemmatimonadota bacterium]